MLVKETIRTIKEGPVRRLDLSNNINGNNFPNSNILEHIGIDEHNDVVYNNETPEVHMLQEDW